MAALTFCNAWIRVKHFHNQHLIGSVAVQVAPFVPVFVSEEHSRADILLADMVALKEIVLANRTCLAHSKGVILDRVGDWSPKACITHVSSTC